MMQRDPFGERVVCFICDYGLVVLVILLVLGVAAWRFTTNRPAAPVPLPVTPTPVPLQTTAPASGGTPVATALPGTPTPIPTPTVPAKPEYVLVFMPVAWTASQADFEQAANEQADQFIRSSHMDDYFTVVVKILPTGPDHVDLTDPTLVETVLDYGLTRMAGDRYIGLTDSDFAPNGQHSVVGLTEAGQSLLVENIAPYIAAHELGHTFGLCDEYNYTEWGKEDHAFIGGCPNPYPANCPQSAGSGVTCKGNPTSDGKNSIMGPAGLPGDYGFNADCLNHLEEMFRTMLTQG